VHVSVFCDRQWTVSGGNRDAEGEYSWCVMCKFVPLSPQKDSHHKQNHEGARTVAFAIQIYLRRDWTMFLSLLEQALNFTGAVKREIASVWSYLSNPMDRQFEVVASGESKDIADQARLHCSDGSAMCSRGFPHVAA
jgi:hypothetical protein